MVNVKINIIQAIWFGSLVVLRIHVELAIFQPYFDLEAGDNQSLKIQVARPRTNPGPLVPQARSLTTRPPLLLQAIWNIVLKFTLTNKNIL